MKLFILVILYFVTASSGTIDGELSLDGLPQGTVIRKPHAPAAPQSTNTVQQQHASQPSPSNQNGASHLYPTLPADPFGPSQPNSGNQNPYGGGQYQPSAPQPNPPSTGHLYPNVPSAPSAPSAPYPNPYDNRNGGNDRDKDSSSGGSTFGSFLNFLRGAAAPGGGDSRLGGGSSSSNGPNYGDIINALSGGGGGNRGGSSGGAGLAGILSTLGNRGSGSSGFSGGNSGGPSFTDILFGGQASGTSTRGGFGGNNYDDRRQQPSQPSQPSQPFQPSSADTQGSKGNEFLSGITSLLGQQLANTLVRNALSGNRDGASGSSDGAPAAGDGTSSGSDFFNKLRYGNVFSEKNGEDANKPKVTVSGAGPGGYPTQAPYRPPPSGYTPQNPN